MNFMDELVSNLNIYVEDNDITLRELF